MLEVADRETAAAIRVALYRAAPDMPSYAAGIIEPYLERHRQQAEDAMRERCAAKVEQRLALVPTLTDRAGSAVLACLPDAIRGIDAGGEGE